MPRARSPNRDKARELWIESGKKRTMKSIAEELGVSESKVRKWKTVDRWDDISNEAKGSADANNAPFQNTAKGSVPINAPIQKEPEKSVPKRGKGGQPGNKNAAGNNGGAPDGNTNADRHGCYSSRIMEFLDEEAKEVFSEGYVDEETELIQEINFLSAREIMFMKAIHHYKGIKGGLAVSEVVSSKTTRDFGKDNEKAKWDKALYDEMIQQKIESGDRLPGNAVEVTTKTEATYSIIQSLEKNLTEVQRQKTRCIETLAKLRAGKGADNTNNTEHTEINIYMPDNGRNKES